MSASSVSGYMSIPIPSGNPQVTATGQGANREGDNEVARGMEPLRARQGGGGPLLNAVTQTLSQLGLGQPGLIAVTAPAATPNASGNNTTDSAPSSIGQQIDQTLQTFMHALFQALNQTGGPTPNGPTLAGNSGDGKDSPTKAASPAGATGYTNLVSQLQNFVQNLESKENTATSAASGLHAAFQNLAQAPGNNSLTTSGSDSTQASLQSFLQDLLQNLQNAGNPPLSGLGNAVKTFA